MSERMTHYVRYDNPGWNGRIAMAVCGRFVNPHTDFSASPTCEKCQAWVKADDALSNDPDEVFGKA